MYCWSFISWYICLNFFLKNIFFNNISEGEHGLEERQDINKIVFMSY